MQVTFNESTFTGIEPTTKTSLQTSIVSKFENVNEDAFIKLGVGKQFIVGIYLYEIESVEDFAINLIGKIK